MLKKDVLRRLPVYLLIDTSESMVGTAIESVQGGIGTLMTALRKNPYALEMGAISIITFDRTAKKAMPLTDIFSFHAQIWKLRRELLWGPVFGS